MNTLSRTRLMDQTLQELRRLKENVPAASYHAALQIAAPGLLERLLEHYDELESTSSEQVCQLVADWLWLRILGWCQKHQIPEEQCEDLFKLIEAVRNGLPLPVEALTIKQSRGNSDGANSPILVRK